jgi:copper chaperone CopZ
MRPDAGSVHHPAMQAVAGTDVRAAFLKEECMIRTTFLLLVAMAMILPPTEAIAPANTVYELDFTGMTCAVCRKKIKEILCRLENVKEVEIDLKTKKVYVTMNGEKTLSRATVDAAFKETKYSVVSMVEKKQDPKAESKPTGS